MEDVQHKEISLDEGIELISAFIRAEYIPSYKEYVMPYRKAADIAVKEFPDFEPREVYEWHGLKNWWKLCQTHLADAIRCVRYSERNPDDPTIAYTLSCIPKELGGAREWIAKTKWVTAPTRSYES